MKIIQAELKDIEIVTELFDMYRQFYEQPPDIVAAREFLFQRMTNKDSVIFLAINDKGEGTGFVQLYPSFTSVGMKRLWILNDLFIHKDHRRRGVGQALLERCRQFSIQTNATGLILETRNSNNSARALYEKFGFDYDIYHAYYFFSTLEDLS
jgi:ribosomal protein S18 acetylase RimI-like enzyme